MPLLDTAHAITLPSPTPSELVLTTPLIPGLEVRLPPHTVIHDRDWTEVREVTITPVPLDRTPFPLPEHFDPPVYFTIQPGGAYLHIHAPNGPSGARLVYPNSDRYPNDTVVEFWHYDPDDKGWFVYGTGAVAANSRQVVPNAGIAIYEFTGAMINGGGTPPGYGPQPGNPPKDGDPVDLGTGLFVYQKTDLFLPDVLPLALSRTYRQNDSQSRPFGIGATHPFAMFLWSAQQYQEADLILPDGGRVHYVRTSGGTSFTDAILEHTSSQSTFYKSVLAWNGNGWNLTLKDGTVYVFGDSTPIQSIRDRYGNTISYTWSNTSGLGHGYGNILKVRTSSGRYLQFTYDTSNRVTAVADNSGRTVGYQYDASGRLWKVTDPLNGVTEYTYDTSHRMLTIKDARGITFLTNEYDTNGRVVEQTQADNTTFQFAYTLDGSGKVTQTDVTNPRGYVDRWAFNGAGLPTSHVEAVGTALARTTTFGRASGSSLVDRITDPLGRETAYAYDTAGNVTSVSELDGTADEVTTSFTYTTAFNQLASITDPLNHTTTFGYDTLGRLTSVTDPLNHTTTLTYNEFGLPITITNALNETTTLGYDGTDLTSVTDPLGRTSTRFVDVLGRVLRIANPIGHGTQYVYDALNRVTTVTDPIGGQTTFTYDANSNLLTLTDARNNTTTYTYDNMDRVETRTDPLNRQEMYDYDNNGNLSQVTDRKSQGTAYSYDALDRLTLTTYHDTSTTGYSYDDGDRLTTITDSIGGTITHGWDGLNRLIEEDTPEGLVTYSYDDANRRATMTVDGQSAISYAYDDANRLTEIDQGSATISFAYDNANRRTSLTLPNGISVTYTYDDASQVTGISYGLGQTTLGNLTYAFDVAGNRTAIDGSWARTGLPPALSVATYDAANQVATWGGTSFSYDSNGNLTSDGTNSYTWNARNQLTGLSGGTSASFAYDGLSRRRGKTIGGTTTNFLYDGLNLVQELTSGGTPTANLLTSLGIDETFTRTLSGGTETLLTDGLGSTLELADGSGTLQTHYTFEPFGATTTSGASSTNAAQFTGRENDDTGLYAYRARFYSPALQRFVSEDPIEFAAGDVNLYAYVGNQPTMWRDPSGLIKLFLPPGHPCAWPPEGSKPKSKSDDQAPPEPPLSWWLMCSPTVVPDLLPIPLARPGKTGVPRIRGPIFHPDPHPFPIIGPQPHIQINIWFDGIPGISIPIRIPIPGGPWW